MKKVAISGTLQALERTAEWRVDEAQLAHSMAVERDEQSKRVLDESKLKLHCSHDQLRQLLAEGKVNADALHQHYLQIAHYRDQALLNERQHLDDSRRTEVARQNLLEAKVNKETYSRLSARREQIALHSLKQQQQRITDESGVVRAATSLELFSATMEKT